MSATKERMNELWAEMRGWPIGARMAFAVQLAHLCMDELGASMIDSGLDDSAALREVYLVAGCGGGAEQIKAAVRRMMLEREAQGYTVKVGKGSTPLAPAVEQFVEPGFGGDAGTRGRGDAGTKTRGTV